MEFTFVFAFLFLFHLSHCGTYETHCSSGERLHTPKEGHDVCLPCKFGSFMEDEHHFFRQCKPCKVIRYPDVEVLGSACNINRDAVILCTSGFYRRRARNIMEEDRCVKCTECPFPVRPCEGYYDTVCCPPNHDAVMTPDGVFVCKEKPIVCGAGQFFRTSNEECLPCPARTFMSDHTHTYKDCLKCGELSENTFTHTVITRPCSRTAPTLFGCKAGYFRDPTQESLQIEVPCTPCRICSRSLTDCHMFHDAVCDDKDLMVSTAPTHLTVSIGGFYRRRAGNIMDEEMCEKCTECSSPAQPFEGYNNTIFCPPNHDEVMSADGGEHEHNTSPPETRVNNINKTVELATSTKCVNTNCDFAWTIVLAYVTFVLVNTNLLTLSAYTKKQSNELENKWHNSKHFKRYILVLWLFCGISLIALVLLQAYRTYEALTAFVCSLICLSILVVVATGIIYCK